MTPFRQAATHVAILGLLTVWPGLASAQSPSPGKPVPTAFFGFTLDNTSPAPSTPEELARTNRIADEFANALTKSGKYQLVDMAPAQAMLKDQPAIRSCNGCELPIAKKLGAKLAIYGWVQKVSNLILNINAIVEDADTGKMVAGGSVDIRGNTDDSWDHGVKYLLEEHIFNQH